MDKMMQRALLAAFARGVGGGLSLAAVPYILAGGGWMIGKSAQGLRHCGSIADDLGDAWRYFRELRGHFNRPGNVPGQSWQPEEDGHSAGE
jgi:hypothetical protein